VCLRPALNEDKILVLNVLLVMDCLQVVQLQFRLLGLASFLIGFYIFWVNLNYTYLVGRSWEDWNLVWLLVSG
jgi:hypothetical protein